ncbi:spore germination protein GerPE [Oceanobacillus bengalensis]|uniref:Spore germination protein GerPE n=1 Tax=Oceanobacillus bengalensis TaxID=1435466 RepID=A0A494Z893_9BACI|nr:spore germination protein GerPE [Oceanobacillus bengalensis]RKQ18831.1 spore germination protein GerPE [Oceanobacillus bengalensis]
MNKRTSIVNNIRVTAISNSAIFNIGDSNQSNIKTKAIAVQKEGTLANLDLDFDDYLLFNRRAKWPNLKSTVIKKTYNHNEDIYVQQIAAIGVSSSSVLQIGNMNHIRADSRIKHFRMLEED